jgi:hypothetical protein
MKISRVSMKKDSEYSILHSCNEKFKIVQFFLFPKKIDNPFAEIFIPANTGLREFHKNE